MKGSEIRRGTVTGIGIVIVIMTEIGIETGTEIETETETVTVTDARTKHLEAVKGGEDAPHLHHRLMKGAAGALRRGRIFFIPVKIILVSKLL